MEDKCCRSNEVPLYIKPSETTSPLIRHQLTREAIRIQEVVSPGILFIPLTGNNKYHQVDLFMDMRYCFNLMWGANRQEYVWLIWEANIPVVTLIFIPSQAFIYFFLFLFLLPLRTNCNKLERTVVGSLF